MAAIFQRVMQKKKARVAAAVLVAAIVIMLATMGLSKGSVSIPTAVVERGEFTDALPFQGEVKALKSVTMAAPTGAGDLQIVKIAADGIAVKQGDVVVQFDATKTEQDLAQFRSALRAAEAEIAQAKAQGRLKEEKNLTAVMKGRFDLESAKLDASKHEILSDIDGEEKKLAVNDAEQKLRQAEQQLKSDRDDANAKIANAEQVRKKALYDVQQAERNLAALTLRAPASGIVVLLQSWHGNSRAVMKAGERAWPGAFIANLPDLSSLRISLRVDEGDRGRLQPDQTVTAHFDAIPDREFTGKVAHISTNASQDYTGGWPFPRNFDVEVGLDQTDARMRPGMGVAVRVTVDQVHSAIMIPAQASFQKSGCTVAYVLDGSKFKERNIDIGRRSGTRLLVAKGLRLGEKVALQDPTFKKE